MSEEQDPKRVQGNLSSPTPTSTTPTKVAGETRGGGGGVNSGNSSSHAGWEQQIRYPNRPETTNPDAATLREQWRFAIRQYSKWYSHAWGTAILAGISFFALGWIIKGSNPLPSKKDEHPSPSSPDTPR